MNRLRIYRLLGDEKVEMMCVDAATWSTLNDDLVGAPVLFVTLDGGRVGMWPTPDRDYNFDFYMEKIEVKR